MRLKIKNSNSKLSRRVSKLIQEKPSIFKKKYKLFSLLSNARLNENKNSELDCYVNTLLETNGNSPQFSTVKNFVITSLKENKIKNAESIVLKIENYLNLKYKKSINESLLEDELNLIKVKNYRLDNKIHDTLMESVERRKSIFFESEEGPKMKQHGYGEAVDMDDLFGVADEVADGVENDIKSKVSGKSAPGTASGSISKKIAKELDEMHDEVTSIFKTYSNKAKRKLWIVFHIHSYLNVFRKFSPPMDRQTADNVGRLSDLGEYSRMKSGLTDSEIARLRDQLDSILLRGSENGDVNFEDDSIKENELTSLLKQAMGSSPEAVEDFNVFMHDLNLDFSLNSRTSDFDRPTRSREEFEEETAEELRSIMSDEDFDAETAERKRREDEEERLNDLRNAAIDAEEGPYQRPKQPGDDIEYVDITNMSDEEIANLPPEVGLQLIIREKSAANKRAIYNELLSKSASPEEFLAYVKDFYGTDLGESPMSYADIARVSGGDFTATAGARQEIMKMWFKGVFFATDDSKKAEIAAAAADKWVESIRKLDLIEDENVEIPGITSAKGSKAAAYFEKLEGILTRKSNVLDYLKGSLSDEIESDIETMGLENASRNPESEKLQILHVMFSETTSLRVFIAKLLDKYYHENVWKSSEADLAQAVKEYFNKNFPQYKIDASNKLVSGDVSGKIDKSEGRALFNPIIYWVMGRTGIKDKGGRVSNAQEMTSERLEYFRKKFPKVIEKYNSTDAGVQIGMSRADIEDLLDDMSSDNGIIGSVYAQKRKLDDAQTKEVVSWILGLDDKTASSILASSLSYAEQFKGTTSGDRVFNKELEKEITRVGAEILKDYKSANKDALKKHAAYLSDEYGY